MRAMTKKMTRRFAWMVGGLLLAAQLPAHATVEYIHTDSLGTPVAITDSDGNVIQASEYEPFGKLLNRPLTDAPGYTGHETDATTGMVYAQQRYYDPQIGRFLSMDPVTPEGGGNFNRYEYASDNPYRFTDPDGRQDSETQSQPNQPTALHQREDVLGRDSRSMGKTTGQSAFMQGATAEGSGAAPGGKNGGEAPKPPGQSNQSQSPAINPNASEDQQGGQITVRDAYAQCVKDAEKPIDAVADKLSAKAGQSSIFLLGLASKSVRVLAERAGLAVAIYTAGDRLLTCPLVAGATQLDRFQGADGPLSGIFPANPYEPSK